MFSICYISESGFTKKYADIFAQKTGAAAYDLKQIKKSPLKKGDEVIYLGWLMAGGIKGYKKAAKLFKIKAVCAVGMAAPGSQTPETISKQNKIDGIPVFYLQGGFDISRLKGIYKFMMKTMASTVGKKLSAKTDKTDEEADMLEMMTNGGDRVDPKAVNDVLTVLEQK